MTATATQEVTQLLRAWVEGDASACDQLYRVVYSELRRLAHHYMHRENPGHTLQTTALVNEAYLRLAHNKDVDWKDRAHFFAVSANIMRRILIDEARARRAERRGGDAQQIALDELVDIPQAPTPDLLALDEALHRLARVDERKGKVVELRYFGGLTVEETAEVLGVTPVTIKRHWRMAKAWLHGRMQNE